MPYIYCPCCGNICNRDGDYCNRCKRSVRMQKSNYEPDYYLQKSIEEYGDTSQTIKIFFEEEISKNPLFDQQLYDNIVKEGEAKYKEYLESKKPPLPKCPTCGSTNIQKISDLRKAGGAILFGIFSKDAKSQFECRNCGMKF